MERGRLTERERFVRNFTTGDGCWLWFAAADRHGYGRFARKRGGKWRTSDAHRVSYEIHVGPIPAGLRVLHRCDVPACVRPDHLFLGTAADNTADMMAKGRGRYISHAGEDCGKSKLTWEQVREIRRRLAAGEAGSALAREFGMSESGISSIKHNEVWRNLMHAALLFPKEYLGAADLLDKKTGKPLDVTLTISRLVMEELRTDKGSEDKWVLYFKEIEDRHRDDRKKLNKRLVLNRTNAKSIAKVLGNETNDWVGRAITLYPTTCMAFGKEAECIRVREKAPNKAKAAAPPDDGGTEPPADHVSP